jgi:hypothetical protein
LTENEPNVLREPLVSEEDKVRFKKLALRIFGMLAPDLEWLESVSIDELPGDQQDVVYEWLSRLRGLLEDVGDEANR